MLTETEDLQQLVRLRLRSHAFGFQEIESLITTAALDVEVLSRVIVQALEGRDPDTGNREYIITFDDRELIFHTLIQAQQSIELATQAYEMAWAHEASARGAAQAQTPIATPSDTRPATELLQDVQAEAPTEARKKKRARRVSPAK